MWARVEQLERVVLRSVGPRPADSDVVDALRRLLKDHRIGRGARSLPRGG